MASGYVDKMVSKAGLEYDIQDARITATNASVAGQVVKVNASGTGLEYGTVDVTGSIATHNTSNAAHADIRDLISDNTTAIETESNARSEADTALGTRIAVFENGGAHAVDAVEARVTTIEEKIPSAATSSNQLADKEFVNSSITTNTATFRGTSATGLSEAEFLAWADTLTKTKNDYVFWNTTDASGNTIFKRYKYDGTQWVYEYTLNNSSFTATQWSAINSGVTSDDVTKLNGIEDNANNYTHPAGNAPSQASGLYKFATDATSHITSVSAVAKSDITALGIPAQDTTYEEATTATAGLMSASDKTKLDGVAEGANYYTHPAGSGTNITEGLYKFSTDSTSHIAGATSVAKSDITALGIPAEDTNQTIKGNGSTFGSNAAVDIIPGNNISLTADTTNNTITIAASGGASSVTCTLNASSWSSAAQTVTVSGVTASTVGVFGLATTANAAQYAAAAEAQLLVTAQSTDSITVTAYGTVPTVDIPCVMNING